MTVNELRDKMVTLRAKKDEVDLLIADAGMAAKQTGVYADRAQYGSWLKMQKHYGREIQKAGIELSIALKAERAEKVAQQDLSFERQFMRVAKRLLTDEVYMTIMRNVAEETGAA